VEVKMGEWVEVPKDNNMKELKTNGSLTYPVPKPEKIANGQYSP
jgi:hypothetical protein